MINLGAKFISKKKQKPINDCHLIKQVQGLYGRFCKPCLLQLYLVPQVDTEVEQKQNCVVAQLNMTRDE
jgi:hypothetical protein